MVYRPLKIAATAMLLLMVAAPVLAQDDDGSEPADTIELETTSIDPEPFGVCFDGTCYVSDEQSRGDLELVAGDDTDLYFTDEGDAPGQVVCPEGFGDCYIKGDEISIEDIALTLDGRVVYGAVDGEMAGTWEATNRRATMTCRVTGFKPTKIKLKKTLDSGFVERRPDGRLVASGLGADKASFLLARFGPGVYASVFDFSEGKVKGKMHSFYGMLSEDKIAGTSHIESSFKVRGRKGKCTMDRNFDLERVSGPDSDIASDDDPDEMEFSEEEAADAETAP